MNFSVLFEREPLSLADHGPANKLLYDQTKRLVVELKPVLAEMAAAKVGDRLKTKSVKKMSVNFGQTMTEDGLTERATVAAAKVKEQRVQAKERQQLDQTEARHYFNQMLKYHDPSDGAENKRTFYMQLATRAMNVKLSAMNGSMNRDRVAIRAQVWQLRTAKAAFAQFMESVHRQLADYRDQVAAEKDNTRRPRSELEERTQALDNAENRVLNLLKRMAAPEGCYAVVTWLSPDDWKAKHAIEKLNYDFARSDTDVNRSSNTSDYLNRAYQRSLEQFHQDIQSEPVLPMYWTSAEHFVERLQILSDKTRTRMLILDIMSESTKPAETAAAAAAAATKSKLQRRLAAARNRLRHKLVAKKHLIDEIIAIQNADDGADGADYKRARWAIHGGGTMVRIKSILMDVFTAFRQPYGDMTSPYRMFKMLCDWVYNALAECEDIPAAKWRLTDRVLRSADAHRAKSQAEVRAKLAVVRMTQREADRMFAPSQPAAARVQKPMPYRLWAPAKKRPPAPAKRSLADDQLRYLKWFTYLTPDDVDDDDMDTVPRGYDP